MHKTCTHDYDDIINLPHPDSKKHPRMSIEARAAQFAPFSALTGHEEAVKETARITDIKNELTEDEIIRLNERLNIIRKNLCMKHIITITYFVNDEKKSGGSYVSHTGSIKKIDEYRHVLTMDDNTVIPISQISEIGGEIFDRMGIYD